VGTTENDEKKKTSLEDEHMETTIDSTTQNINYGFEEQKENTNL
jgi:hypothetical protein